MLGSKCSLDCNLFVILVWELFIPKLRNWVQKRKRVWIHVVKDAHLSRFCFSCYSVVKGRQQQDGLKILPSSARQRVVQILPCSCMELWRALSFHWSFLSSLLFSLQGHQHNIWKKQSTACNIWCQIRVMKQLATTVLGPYTLAQFH